VQYCSSAPPAQRSIASLNCHRNSTVDSFQQKEYTAAQKMANNFSGYYFGRTLYATPPKAIEAGSPWML